MLPERPNLNFDEQVEDNPKVKEEISVDGESNQPFREDPSDVRKVINAGIILKEKKPIPEKDVNKVDKPTNAASSSPKRRKVVKTVIDERGREGTPWFRCLSFQKVPFAVCCFASSEGCSCFCFKI